MIRRHVRSNGESREKQPLRMSVKKGSTQVTHGQYLPPELPGLCLKLAAPVRDDSNKDFNSDAGRPLSLEADS